jgi:hypothetical protein
MKYLRRSRRAHINYNKLKILDYIENVEFTYENYVPRFLDGWM